MAEGYFKKMLKESSKDISVASAGTATFPGMKASQEAVEVMREIGIDISGHQSNEITRDMIKDSDIILVMEPAHMDVVAGMVPEKKDDIFFLRQFEKKDTLDKFIPDPIGKSMTFYRNVLNVIKTSTEGFLKWLED